MNMKSVKRIKDRRGATAIEFAFILPLLIILFFGTLELGLYLFNKHVITNAGREGARAGIVVQVPRLTNDEIESEVKKYCEDHLVTFGSGGGPVVTLKIVTGSSEDTTPASFEEGTERCTQFGCDLEVTVNYDYDFLVLSNLGFGPTTMTAVSVMRME